MSGSGRSRPIGRATVSAPANIAFVKYWGARDEERVLPVNPSISMTLEACRSTTTVEAREADGLAADEILLASPADDRGGDGPPALRPAPEEFARRARGHLDVLRRLAGRPDVRFRVATRNSFPAAAGLASSASGFAALAGAVTAALGLDPSPAELSELARLSGSGSAARSVFGGYVEWPAGPDDARAAQIAPAGAWPLADVVALVETGPKEVSSLAGHRRAGTSPFFARRQELLPERLEIVREAIRRRDFDSLGPEIEREAIDLHVVAMTSRPPIFYWAGATLDVLAAVRALRAGGIAAWATMDAGANVHVITPLGESERVAERLRRVPGVTGVIADRVGDGPRAEATPLLPEPASAEG